MYVCISLQLITTKDNIHLQIHQSQLYWREMLQTWKDVLLQYRFHQG